MAGGRRERTAARPDPQLVAGILMLGAPGTPTGRAHAEQRFLEAHGRLLLRAEAAIQLAAAAGFTRNRSMTPQ